MENNLRDDCLEALQELDVFTRLVAAGTMLFCGEKPPCLPTTEEIEQWIGSWPTNTPVARMGLEASLIPVVGLSPYPVEERPYRLADALREIESWVLAYSAAGGNPWIKNDLELLSTALTSEYWEIGPQGTEGDWADEAHRDQLWFWRLQPGATMPKKPCLRLSEVANDDQ